MTEPIRLLRFRGARRPDDIIDNWLAGQPDPLGSLAAAWFERFRACGDDVRELIHDGQPTACLGDVALGYVAVYRAHVNVGFFRGAELPDPAGLLTGSGKLMRHVKLRPGQLPDESALEALIGAAYRQLGALLADVEG